MVQFKPYYTADRRRALHARGLDPEVPAAHRPRERRADAAPRHVLRDAGQLLVRPAREGAYFKEEAIAFAWEFVTQVLGLPQRAALRLDLRRRGQAAARRRGGGAVEEDRACAADHIVALGRTDNFWGPAGGRARAGRAARSTSTSASSVRTTCRTARSGASGRRRRRPLHGVLEPRVPAVRRAGRRHADAAAAARASTPAWGSSAWR